MSKLINIRSKDEIDYWIAKLRQSATRTRNRLLELTSTNDAMGLLKKMKFDEEGCDPFNEMRCLNLVEQINQTFTYLASLNAAKELFDWWPGDAPFVLNLGTHGGPDIISENGEVIAEVFAAVDPNNNKKLMKDAKRVHNDKKAAHKYVFYTCPKYPTGKQEGTYSDVIVWSLPLEVEES
jgi:hypothetical protein